MKVYTSGSEKNMYSCIAGSKYFNKFCRSLGITLNEMEILRVLLNNQDEYITHNEEITDYTGLTEQQIKDAIKRLKTRPYINIKTVREGMNRVRHIDLWEFCNKFDEYVDSNFKSNNKVLSIVNNTYQKNTEHLDLRYKVKEEETTFQQDEKEMEALFRLI